MVPAFVVFRVSLLLIGFPFGQNLVVRREAARWLPGTFACLPFDIILQALSFASLAVYRSHFPHLFLITTVLRFIVTVALFITGVYRTIAAIDVVVVVIARIRLA